MEIDERFNRGERYKFGSIGGLIISVLIGLAGYFLLPLVPSLNIDFYAYSNLIDGINNSFIKQVLWFFINFSEPVFIAGAVSGFLFLTGGFIAWRLAIKGSKRSGIPISGGNSNIWPWVATSQILSLLTTMYVFNYMGLFDIEGVTWVPTFIVIVSTPGAILLTYGPTIPNLLTAAILPAAFSTPIAYWITNTVLPLFKLPGGLGNILSMTIVAFSVMAVCEVLPWIEKKSVKPIPSNGVVEDVYSTKWFLRRILADFTEPHFFGNEIAGLGLLIGGLIDYIINSQHGLGGGVALWWPVIILTQFISGGVGIFLYAQRYENGGFTSTFIPIAATAPFVLLSFEPSFGIAVFVGIAAGIICAPLEATLGKLLPNITPVVSNTLAMVISTSVIWATVATIPVFGATLIG